jgi:hypothetical protein
MKKLYILIVLSLLNSCVEPPKNKSFLEKANESLQDLNLNSDSIDENLKIFFEKNSQLSFDELLCPPHNKNIYNIGEHLNYWRIADVNGGEILLNTNGNYSDLLTKIENKYNFLEPYCFLVKNSGDIPPNARIVLLKERNKLIYSDENIQTLLVIHIMYICFNAEEYFK